MEAIQKLFEGQELSEEFVTKASALLESKISEKEKELQEAHDAKVTELEESTQKKIDEEIVPQYEEMTVEYVNEHVLPEINKYLSMAVNEWIEENKLEAESKVKVAMAESLLEGISGVLSENNMQVDPKQDTVVEEMQSKVEELESKLNEHVSEKADLIETVNEMKRKSVIESVCKELTESQKEKISEKSEGVEFKDEDQFSTAIQGLVESHFPTEDDSNNVVTENKDVDQQTITESNDYYSKFLKVYK